MIDYNKATQAFETYLDQYNREDDKINLKIVHTYGVVTAAEYIAKNLNLDSENFQLAKLIALLHDIGRFEQLKRYNSFDDRIIDHAILGVEILKEQDFIREFVTDPQYDETIYTALYNHNTFAINPEVQGNQLLHTQIIRDADKLDNYRVKVEEKFETLFDISQFELEDELITPKIAQEFRHNHLIMSSDRKTHLDMWLSYLAFMFDLNFEASKQFIIENDYTEILFTRVTPKDPSTLETYLQLKKIALSFLETAQP